MLYRFDLNPDRDPTDDASFVAARLHHKEDLVEFATALLNGVLRNRGELDQMLETKAENWSLTRMAATDRNVLRMGAYEILFTETPGRVAINEAVDLCVGLGMPNPRNSLTGFSTVSLSTKIMAESYVKPGPSSP